MITLLIVLASIASYLGIGRVAAVRQISVHAKDDCNYSNALKYVEEPDRYSYYSYEAKRFKEEMRFQFITMNLLWLFWIPCQMIYSAGKFVISGANPLSIDNAIEKHTIVKQIKVKELERKNEVQAQRLVMLEAEAEKNRVPDILDELEKY